MDKMTAGLIGAMAGLATMGAAQATTTAPAVTPSHALQASSYADLLEPIPDAAALLKADDATRAQERLNTSASFQLAEWEGYGAPYEHHHHHHHHHHHQRYNNYYGYYNRGDEHHHHHHHHNYSENRSVGIPGVGGFVVQNRRD